MPYDPRSSRPTPKTVPDEESAPVDVLLGPSPDGTDADGDVAAPVAPLSESSSVRSDAMPLPVPVRKGGLAPSPILQLAPLLIAVAVALFWLIRRSRR